MRRAYDLVTRSYFRYILISLGLLLVGYTTYEMTILPLWGYRPMGWMLGLYFISTGLLWKRITKTIAAFRRWLLSVGTGLMLSICFPMSWLLPLVFIALVPLLYIADEEEISFWTLIGHAFGAFYLYNVITTFWVLNTSFAPGIIANGLNAFLMTLPWMLFYVMRRKFARKQAFIGLALFYIAFEYIHLYWEISWPWLNYGNIFATFPDLVQWYEFTGAFGGAYWIWATNLLIFFLLRGYLSGKKWQGILVAVLILPLIASALLIGIRDNVGPEAEVVIIQPNYEPHYEKFDIPSSVQLKHMVQLAQMEVEESTDFILFPETVIRRVWLNRIDRHPGVKAFRSLTVDHPNLNVVSGVSSFRSYDPDSLMNPATRVDISARGDTTYWDLQNAALWIADGAVKEDYFKSKLVPGAEIFPYVELLGFLEPVIDALDGSKEGHFIQQSREVFGPDGKKIAPVICYESIYGDYVSDYIHEGAQAIFIMTNDGWWDNTPGHRQHLALARLRAIEMRRHIARSANTGISCFIDQKGKVYQASSYDEAIAIKGEIQLNRGITFYAKHGDYLAYIALLVTLLAIVILLRGQVIPEKIQ